MSVYKVIETETFTHKIKENKNLFRFEEHLINVMFRVKNNPTRFGFQHPQNPNYRIYSYFIPKEKYYVNFIFSINNRIVILHDIYISEKYQEASQ